MLCAVAVMSVPGLASAQGEAGDAPTAGSLFKEGNKLLEAGKVAEACEKLAESQRMKADVDTLLLLASCREREGKTFTAYTLYQEAVESARKVNSPKRQKRARDRIAALEPMLSSVTVAVAAGHDEALVVNLDGVAVGSDRWGQELRLDPGEHKIDASAPGKQTWEHTLTLGASADRQRVEIPPLQDPPPPAVVAPVPGTAEPEAAAPPPPQEAPPAPPPAAQPETDTGGSGTDLRQAAYFAGAAGLLSFGLGTYFGLQAFDRWDDRDNHCKDGACDAAAVQFSDDAESAALKANVFFAVGAVGLAAGITMLVLSDGDDGQTSQSAQATRKAPAARVRLEPAVGQHGGGLLLGGAW